MCVFIGTVCVLRCWTLILYSRFVCQCRVRFEVLFLRMSGGRAFRGCRRLYVDGWCNVLYGSSYRLRARSFFAPFSPPPSHLARPGRILLPAQKHSINGTRVYSRSSAAPTVLRAVPPGYFLSSPAPCPTPLTPALPRLLFLFDQIVRHWQGFHTILLVQRDTPNSRTYYDLPSTSQAMEREYLR